MEVIYNVSRSQLVGQEKTTTDVLASLLYTAQAASPRTSPSYEGLIAMKILHLPDCRAVYMLLVSERSVRVDLPKYR